MKRTILALAIAGLSFAAFAGPPPTAGPVNVNVVSPVPLPVTAVNPVPEPFHLNLGLNVYTDPGDAGIKNVYYCTAIEPGIRITGLSVLYSSSDPFALTWQVVFEEETWNTNPLRIAAGTFLGEHLAGEIRYANAQNVPLSVITGAKPRICVNTLVESSELDISVFGGVSVFGERL